MLKLPRKGIPVPSLPEERVSEGSHGWTVGREWDVSAGTRTQAAALSRRGGPDLEDPERGQPEHRAREHSRTPEVWGQPLTAAEPPAQPEFLSCKAAEPGLELRVDSVPESRSFQVIRCLWSSELRERVWGSASGETRPWAPVFLALHFHSR